MRRDHRCCWWLSIARTSPASAASTRRHRRSPPDSAPHAPPPESGPPEGEPARTHGMRPPRRAVILAAGQGIRLRSTVDDRPKGLIEIGGEPLVGRSIRLLRDAGVDEVTIVGGHLAGQYADFCVEHQGI